MGLRWRLLVQRIQARKKWSDKGRILNYSRNGLPRNLDDHATSFGKHLGRWGYREIAYDS